ncbi:MAG: serine/threonine protein kinase, partial [Labilithrix sp.]|nr:serine/threonine protein kinase [Labilithrix sp.]
MGYRIELPVEDPQPSFVGRYLLQQPIARGGMATVHAARLVVGEGVTRLVAAKRLHPQYVDDPEFVVMFHDEARIASRIHHPNVVPVLDVIHDGDEVILVQEYVHGVPLSNLFKLALAAGEPVPLPITLAVLTGVLAGLHAAHEATDDLGDPLGIVHRDVSPQNVLVSVDGIPRLVDFGIAKAKTSVHHTREGFLKGKLAYMSPEQLRAEPVSRSADVYAAGVLLWELVVNRRFYDGKNDPDFVRAVALGSTPTPTQVVEAERGAISAERWAQVYLLEPIIARAMACAPEDRYATAAEMAAALAEIAPSAPPGDVAAWVRVAGAEYIEKRERLLVASEEKSRPSAPRVVEDVVRSSCARVRADAVTLDASSSSRSRPRRVDGTRPLAARKWLRAWLRGATRDALAFAPRAPVAGLLVVLGLLAGIAVTRASAVRGTAERRATVAESSPAIATTLVSVSGEPVAEAAVTEEGAPASWPGGASSPGGAPSPGA